MGLKFGGLLIFYFLSQKTYLDKDSLIQANHWEWALVLVTLLLPSNSGIGKESQRLVANFELLIGYRS